MKIKICVTLILNSFECFLKRLSFTKQKKIRIKSQFHLLYLMKLSIGDNINKSPRTNYWVYMNIFFIKNLSIRSFLLGQFHCFYIYIFQFLINT